MLKSFAIAVSLVALAAPVVVDAQAKKPAPASAPAAPDAKIAPALKSAVAKYIKSNNPDLQGVPQIAAAPIPGTDYALVYLRFGQWCGSGGCHPDIFKRQGNTYVWAGELAVSRLPIRVIPGKAGKMPSLAISTYRADGDKMVAEYGVVTNDGNGWSKEWPATTTTAAVGQVLISGKHFEPLF